MQRWARLLVVLSLGVAGLLACQPPTPLADAAQELPSVHDLSLDEGHGGHTLERHVGRNDADLRRRLEQEPSISAASTYTDRTTAERVIAAALKANTGKINRWLQRGPRRPNLVLDYTDPSEPIGRTMNRRALGSVPCDHAIVVLKADDDSYYILTSYPECRP